MSEINASKFKEQCLWLLDHLTSEGITITKRGKPVAKLIPIEGSCAGLIGSLKGNPAEGPPVVHRGEMAC